ncbi:MAG: tRNA (N6-threonylcarbamoyladenosine(37)-N6)-methyltransferase TrmO [Gammaproteobacteria bacterium]|nr:tRNA (N6-threonylcarbamoyladenosine(37)-N6)-methyltransferase TrmO [Gammaproteobacteria bacterium]
MSLSTEQSFSVTPIGFIESPFKEKFAIPRQPRLASAALGTITLVAPFNHPDTVRDLEQFSHIWIIFRFDQTADLGWKPLVRPPRLGGNRKTGVFSTRSTFRPNSIGMSAVKLERVVISGNQATIEVSGLDLLDGTPVLDIKPYIPYSDAIEANGGFAEAAPEITMTIEFSEQALIFIQQQQQYPALQQLVEQVLAQDPRPAYKRQSDQIQHYGVRLYDFDVQWQVINNITLVTGINTLVSKSNT